MRCTTVDGKWAVEYFQLDRIDCILYSLSVTTAATLYQRLAVASLHASIAKEIQLVTLLFVWSIVNRIQKVWSFSSMHTMGNYRRINNNRYHSNNIVIKWIILEFALRTFFKMAFKTRSLWADHSIAFIHFDLVFLPSSTLMKYFHIKSMDLPPVANSNWKIPVENNPIIFNVCFKIILLPYTALESTYVRLLY